MCARHATGDERGALQRGLYGIHLSRWLRFFASDRFLLLPLGAASDTTLAAVIPKLGKSKTSLYLASLLARCGSVPRAVCSCNSVLSVCPTVTLFRPNLRGASIRGLLSFLAKLEQHSRRLGPGSGAP